MKIVFLDIDGVLNGFTMHKENYGIIKTPGGELSKQCLDTFNRFIEETKASIVLSTTWRWDKDVDIYLRDAGLQGEIIGKTPLIHDRFSLRGNEIHAWIVENKGLIGKEYYDFYSFVIFDDDSDMLLWHKENYFRTDNYTGITPNVTYRAARFLNRF